MLTVVAKLFGLVQPQVAVFGTKDYQQLRWSGALVRDLCLPVDILGVETVREPTAWRSARGTAISPPTSARRP